MELPKNKSTNPTFIIRLTHTDEEHAIAAVASRIVKESDPTYNLSAMEEIADVRQQWEAEQFKGVVVTGNAKGYRTPANLYTFDVEVEHDPSIDVGFVRTRFAAYGHIPHDVTPHRWTLEGC